MALRLNSQFCSQTAKQVPWGRKYQKVAATSYNVYVSQNQTCKAPIIKINDRRTTVHKPIEIERRSANYKPNIWEHDFIQTLNNEYSGEVHVKRAEDLKNKVRHLFLDHMHDEKNSLALLELISDIERLGLGYLFEKDIERGLSFLNDTDVEMKQSLHAVALKFRVFRQHGFNVSQDVFKIFTDTQGKFMDHQSKDVAGILSLYEATYLSIEGENILDEARTFTKRHLKGIKENIDTNLAELVNHALDLPLNLRITRAEARWCIDALSRKAGVNSNLLELAKLDYNIVQAAHQKDVIDMSRWWKNLGLPKKLPFARNRLVECFLWSVGVAYDPQYSYLRQELTKLVILLTTIDDIYDIYATFEEAELFSDAVERWDVSAVEQLPDYMKLCYLALYNTINEIAYDTLKEHGLNIIPCLRKTLVAQFESFKLEAKWFHNGYKPTLQEYLDNACISLGGPLVLVHSYFLMQPEITKEALEYIESYPSLIRLTSMILRLVDDLGTSKAEVERGDVPKSIQCYMHENDVNEEVARKYIRHLADETWKKMNAELLVDSPVPQAFVKLAVNWIRTAEATYQNEDGHGVPDKETKTRVLSLLVDPIPIA